MGQLMRVGDIEWVIDGNVFIRFSVFFGYIDSVESLYAINSEKKHSFKNSHILFFQPEMKTSS